MRRNREGEMRRYRFFLPSCARASSKFYPLLLKNPTSATRNIECFHSRGQHLCKFIGTKESVCIRKEFNSHRTGLGLQHGRRFIVLGHQYGRRDAMWKHSIGTRARGNGRVGDVQYGIVGREIRTWRHARTRNIIVSAKVGEYANQTHIKTSHFTYDEN